MILPSGGAMAIAIKPTEGVTRTSWCWRYHCFCNWSCLRLSDSQWCWNLDPRWDRYHQQRWRLRSSRWQSKPVISLADLMQRNAAAGLEDTTGDCQHYWFCFTPTNPDLLEGWCDHRPKLNRNNIRRSLIFQSWILFQKKACLADIVIDDKICHAQIYRYFFIKKRANMDKTIWKFGSWRTKFISGWW